MIGFSRLPLALFGIFGLAIFATFLITSIFNNVGDFSMSLDFSQNKKHVSNWIGLAFYISNDIFACGVMAQVV